MNARGLGIVCVVLAVFWSAGCARNAGTSDEREQEHPLMKRAQERERSGNDADAIRIYRFLLGQDPSVARAHLALAFLLDKPGGDYVAAIYHYRRYLELRPETEKADMLRKRIRAAEISFVGKMFSSVSNLTDHINQLEQENAALKVRTTNLQAQAQQLRTALTQAQARLAQAVARTEKSLSQMAPPAAGMQPALRTVKVEKGDTLLKIAARVYGDSGRWKDILEANRGTLRKAEDVRVGQQLVLP